MKKYLVLFSLVGLFGASIDLSVADSFASWRSVNVDNFGTWSIDFVQDSQKANTYNFELVGSIDESGDFKNLLTQMADDAKSVIQDEKDVINLTIVNRKLGSFVFSGDTSEQQAAVKKIKAAIAEDIKNGKVRFVYSGYSFNKPEGSSNYDFYVSFVLPSESYTNWATIAGNAAIYGENGAPSAIASGDLQIKLLQTKRDLFNYSKPLDTLFQPGFPQSGRQYIFRIKK